MSRLALLLDRTQQWGPVKEICANSDAPVALLVHGDAGQDVHLFCERIHLHLTRECRQRVHQSYRVLFRIEYTRARAVADWEHFLMVALGCGDLPGALSLATSHRSIMLILGNGPLRDLDADETEALTTFLGDRLPALIAEARCANPVRVLVPIEHRGHADGLEDPLVKAVYGALQRAAGAGFQTEILIELTFPGWSEVRAYIVNELFKTAPIDTVFMERCRQAYEGIAARPSGERTFADLATALDEIIEEWKARAWR